MIQEIFYGLSRADPRQDPLLGPLLAELDTMSNQQQQHQQQRQLPVSPPSNYRRNSVPYQPNLVRPIGSSPSNHGNLFLFPYCAFHTCI